MMSAMPADSVPTLNIGDKVCEEAGLTFHWAGPTSLAVFGQRNPKTERNKDSQSALAPCDAKVHLLREDSILDDPELRRLINESNATFISSRNVPDSVDPPRRMLELSREHRSSIRLCIEGMYKGGIEKYTDWVELLDNIDTIWHLCELLYLDFSPSDIILPKLLEWTRFHSTDNDIRASEILALSQMKGADHRNHDYWEVLTGLLLEGRFNDCRALLRLHSEADQAHFIEADSLLRGMPLYAVYCGLSVAEFNLRWKGWKSLVRSKIDSGAFQASPKLRDMMNLIGGNVQLLDLLKPHCRTWYNMMTSYLLFTEQTVKIHDLNYHAHQCIEYYGGPSALKMLDQTLLALLDSNLSMAIKKLHRTADGGWCAVHLSNLLYLAGILDTPMGQGIDLEPMLLEYGQFLVSHPSFWQVGFTYLEHCKEGGRQVIEITLSNLPITSDNMALKVIHSAKQYGLDEVASSVCRTMMSQRLNKRNLAAALTWALHGKDVESVTRIADKYLLLYSEKSPEINLSCYNVLNNLDPCVSISPRLTFLAKYCEFHKLITENQFKDAAFFLIRLIVSKVAPKFFWSTLLSDAIPLLEHQCPVPLFSQDDLTVIMSSLEELVAERPDAFDKSSGVEQNLRKALAQNLATAILLESCPAPGPNILICD